MSDDIRNIDAVDGAKSKLSIGSILALVALGVFVIFIFQNTGESDVQLLWMNIDIPVWLLGTIIFLLGVVVGYYAKSRKVRAKRKATK